jgi:galactokinase/mevalonate kinase-like predicted kinase
MQIETVPLLPAAIEEFQARFVVAFTGKQRLARNILQLVVERYLRRDARTLGAIRALVEFADEGRAALAMGRLDELGGVLRGAWSALQQLTPECSNPQIDALFREVEDLSVGGKLAGAGGGGFMGVLAKDAEAAGRIRAKLSAADPALKVYDWTLDR